MCTSKSICYQILEYQPNAKRGGGAERG